MVKDRMKQEACDEFEEKLFDVFNKVLWVVNDKFQEFQDIMIRKISKLNWIVFDMEKAIKFVNFNCVRQIIVQTLISSYFLEFLDFLDFVFLWFSVKDININFSWNIRYWPKKTSLNTWMNELFYAE